MKKEARVFTVLSDEDTLVDNNRTVHIEVKGTSPIVGGYVANKSIDIDYIKNVDNTTPTTAENKNFLVDKNDLSRLTYIGDAISLISNRMLSIYYDAKYKDILLINDVKSIGIDNDISFYENNVAILTAYAVGNGAMQNYPHKEIVLPLMKEDKQGIENPGRTSSITTTITSVTGLAGNSMVHTTYTDIPGTYVSLASKHLLPMQFITLTTSAISDVNYDVPAYNILNQFFSGDVIEYVNRRHLDRIIIPIMF